MITLRFQIIIGILIIWYFLLIFYYLNRGRLLLKYTLLWLLAGVFLGIMDICPGLMRMLASLFGIYSDANALFMFALAFIVVLLMSLTAIVSKQANQNKRITQYIAIQDKRLRDLEMMQREEKGLSE